MDKPVAESIAPSPAFTNPVGSGGGMELFAGNAIVLPYIADGKAPITCTMNWESEITVTLRGNEGRGGFRAFPRPKLVYTARTCSMAQSADLRSRLLAAFDLDGVTGGLGRVAVPWQARACWLAAAAPAGTTNLHLEPTPWPWREADGWIAFSDPQSAAAGLGWTYGSTTGITGGVDLGLAAPLSKALPAGAAVYPLMLGRLAVENRATLLTDARLSQPLTVWGENQFIAAEVPQACVVQSPPDLQPFDFAVVRYQWTSANGNDLDTRTALTTPAIAGEVGYNRQGRVPPYPAQPYLSWGGDNRLPAGGAEAVLIDFARIATNFPTAATIVIRLRAYWWRARGDGNIHLQFSTYSGGSMQGSNFDFVNVGGQAVQTINKVRAVATLLNEDHPGDEMGTLVYTPATRSAVILPPP